MLPTRPKNVGRPARWPSLVSPSDTEQAHTLVGALRTWSAAAATAAVVLVAVAAVHQRWH